MFASAVGDWYNGSPAMADLYRAMVSISEASADVDSDQSLLDTTSTPFSLTALESQLPQWLGKELIEAFDQKALRKELGLSSKASRRKRHKGEHGKGSAAAIPTSATVREAVKLLTNSVDILNSDRAVVRQVGGGATASRGGLSHNASLCLQFTPVARRLKLELLSAVISEEFGPHAQRVWKVLAEHGKLDEKAIKDLALLPMKDTRELCTKMLRATLLQLQEVPKQADRSVMRTIFLYYVDIDRAYSWLLDRWYHTLENLNRRRVLQDALSWTLLQRVETAQAATANADKPSSSLSSSITAEPSGTGNEKSWTPDKLAQSANATTSLARSLLRDAELAQWQRLQNDRLMLTLAQSRLLRDVFVLSHLPS